MPDRTNISENQVLVTGLAFVFILGLVVLLWFSNKYQNERLLEIVLSQEIEGEKLYLSSQLAESARARTRLTGEIIDLDDVFEQDEKNQLLEKYAGEFARYRTRYMALPLEAREREIFAWHTNVVPVILPAQRKAVQLAMDGAEENRRLAKDILYDTVYPGQGDLIDSFLELSVMSQQRMSEAVTNYHRISEEGAARSYILLFGALATGLLLAFIVIRHIHLSHRQIRGHRDELEGKVYDRTFELLTKQHELEGAIQNAEEANRAKSAFLANMSHEIRTPMNAIIGFSEVVLNDESLTSDTKGHLKTIHSAAKSLLTVINDILDFSKLESGKMKMDSVCFNLPNLVAECLQTVEFDATTKALQLKSSFDELLPNRIMGDPSRLRQVLLNLVGNAVKFTEQGSVCVNVQFHDKPEMAHFSVTDTGIGMTGKQMERVFESFTQADVSTTRRYGGTGLGTTISKQLVESMGGEIWAESVEGEGSTFHFTYPLTEATAEEKCLYEDDYITRHDYVSPRLFRILLAEDIEANATLAIMRLEQQGHSVTWVENGRDAVDESQASPYDIILMDIMMPVMDGLEATRAIRQAEEVKGRHTPIIALTASVLDHDREKCLVAGMDAVARKPIDFNLLLLILEESVPAGKGLANSAEHSEKYEQGGMDFSVMEAVADTVTALRRWLEPEAYAKALAAFAEERRDDALKMTRIFTQRPGDVETLLSEAHALKGLAGNLGLDKIANLAGELESELRSGQRDQVEELLHRITQALEQAVGAIEKLVSTTGDVGGSEVRQPFDIEKIATLLQGLLSKLDELDPDAVEPVIKELAEHLPIEKLGPVQHAVEVFDFESAKGAVQALVDALDLK